MGPPRGPRGTGKWGRCWNRVTVGGSGGNGRKTGAPGWEPRFAGLLRRQTERVPTTPSPLHRSTTCGPGTRGLAGFSGDTPSQALSTAQRLVDLDSLVGRTLW